MRVCREQPSLGSSQGRCSCPGRGVAGLGTSSCESPRAGRGSQTGIDPKSRSVADPSLLLIPSLWVSSLLKPRWGHSYSMPIVLAAPMVYLRTSLVSWKSSGLSGHGLSFPPSSSRLGSSRFLPPLCFYTPIPSCVFPFFSSSLPRLLFLWLALPSLSPSFLPLFPLLPSLLSCY